MQDGIVGRQPRQCNIIIVSQCPLSKYERGLEDEVTITARDWINSIKIKILFNVLHIYFI